MICNSTIINKSRRFVNQRDVIIFKENCEKFVTAYFLWECRKSARLAHGFIAGETVNLYGFILIDQRILRHGIGKGLGSGLALAVCFPFGDNKENFYPAEGFADGW